MRIREADDLPRIARVGENFLIAREARIENDFSAPAAASAGGAAVEDPAVFERKYRAIFSRVCQGILRVTLFRRGVNRSS